MRVLKALAAALTAVLLLTLPAVARPLNPSEKPEDCPSAEQQASNPVKPEGVEADEDEGSSGSSEVCKKDRKDLIRSLTDVGSLLNPDSK